MTTSSKDLSNQIFVNAAPEPVNRERVKFVGELAFVIIILLGALLLRLYNLNRLSLWFDEANDVYLGYQTPLAQTLFFFNPYLIHPPLFFSVLHVWTKVVGISEFAVRLFSVVMAMATLIAIYPIMRSRLNQKIALTSLLLLSVSSLQLSWSQSVRPYSWFTLLVTISMFFALLASEKPQQNWRWIVYGLSGTVLLYQEYLSFHVIFAQAVFLAIVLFKNRRALIRLGLTLTWLGLSFLPWLGNFLEQAKSGNAFYLKNQGFSQLAETLEAFSGWFIDMQYKFLLGALVGPLFVLGALWLWRNQQRMFWLLMTWSLLPVLTAWTSSLVRPNFAMRYFVFCLPAYLIIVATGIWSVERYKQFIPYVATLAVVLLNMIAILNYNNNYTNQDWRTLVNYVIANQQPGDIVIYGNPDGYTFTAFDYYYQLNYGSPGNIERYQVPSNLFSRQNTPSPSETIASLLKDRKRVWVVNAYDGNANWIVENINPNVTKNFRYVFYKEYPSAEQGSIALSLLERNN